MRLVHRTIERGLVLAAALGLAAAAALGACIAGGPPLDPITEDDAGIPEGDASVPDAWTDAPPIEPHQTSGANPSHGPFSGGQRVVITGNGFSSSVRVFFGETEVTEVIPVDATKVQVTAPPGEAGPVDLTTQNGDDESTRRTLPAGYVYDKLYAVPSSGPVAGGTDVTILGQNTLWDGATQAFIDNQPCASLTVVSPTELTCTTAQGTPGAKSVRVEGGGEAITVLDAFTYEDSTDGFKGGLSGGPLDGKLRVLVYNNFTGDPILGAYVVVGSDMSTAITEQVGLGGVVEITDPAIVAPQTVTVAADCHSPITFVDVPVDTVTVYLDPILTPACGASGDPPSVGGTPGSTGQVRGQLVFPAVNEFQRGPFTVPSPIGNEKVVAYLFSATPNPTALFSLPAPGGAVTPSSPGSIGYEFAGALAPGNRTLYALAGLEDRSVDPPEFTAYAMGVVKGVPVFAGEKTTDIYISMVPMELALTIDASPPAPGPSGPDRLVSQVAIRFGNEGFGILPAGTKTPPLPLSDTVDFVGLPWLGDSLAGSSYFVSSRAVTGGAFLAPMSVVGSVQATTTAFPVTVDGFVGLPTLETPGLNQVWDGRHLDVSFGGGSVIDLTVYDIAAQSGLYHWFVAVPGGGRAVEVPDLRQLPAGGPSSGPITVGIYGARIDGFDYGKVRYRNLRPFGMTAYSLDYVEALLP
jgi:hypothetical protein